MNRSLDPNPITFEGFTMILLIPIQINGTHICLLGKYLQVNNFKPVKIYCFYNNSCDYSGSDRSLSKTGIMVERLSQFQRHRHLETQG